MIYTPDEVLSMNDSNYVEDSKYWSDFNKKWNEDYKNSRIQRRYTELELPWEKRARRTFKKREDKRKKTHEEKEFNSSDEAERILLSRFEEKFQRPPTVEEMAEIVEISKVATERGTEFTPRNMGESTSSQLGYATRGYFDDALSYIWNDGIKPVAKSAGDYASSATGVSPSNIMENILNSELAKSLTEESKTIGGRVYKNVRKGTMQGLSGFAANKVSSVLYKNLGGRKNKGGK